MVPFNNANRLLLFAILAALSTKACNAQATPTAMSEASDGASRASAAAPSATLIEMAPPKPPKVTCSGDQLTISAENSTLRGVLSAVHSCLGVQFEIPEGVAGSRVFEELGPGPARQVLESLLSGTELNYVIGSSDSDPQKIESVLLLSRPTETASAKDATTDRSMTAGRKAWLQRRQAISVSLGVDEKHSAQDETPSTSEAEDADAAPADDSGTASAQAPAKDQSGAAAEASTSANAAAAPAKDQPAAASEGPSPGAESVPIASPTSNTGASSADSPTPNPTASTEQRISDMQQMFQQRRQLNQNQGQNPTTPQP